MNNWVWVGCLLVLLAGCVGSQNRPLQLLSGGEPSYPAEARQNGVEGYVMVRYDVTADGKVANAMVVESRPAGTFEAAALQAVQSWVFKPALRNGVPQMEQGRVSTLTFKLGTGEEYSQY